MKHLGNVSKIHPTEQEIVDVVIGGSPCQDLSVAGKRAGLDGARSGLFMEQIRIIREMRALDKANGRTGEHVRPRYCVWENVPGALSSNDGEDFRAVLEAFCKVRDESVHVPAPVKNGGGIAGWSNSGAVVADVYSVAWRVMDAQYFGVPQRRRRIALVADFGGQSAPAILLDGEGLRWDPEQSRKAWESIAGYAAGSAGGSGCAGVGTFQNTGRGWWNESNVGETLRTLQGGGSEKANLVIAPQMLKVQCDCDGGGEGALVSEEKAYTLSAQNPAEQTLICKNENVGSLNPWDSQSKRLYTVDGVSQALYAGEGGGGRNQGVVYPVISGSLCARADSSPCVDRGQPFVVHAQQDPISSNRAAPAIGGQKQATIAVAYGVDENGNGETRLSEDLHPTLSAGGGKIGQGYPATVYAIDSLSSNSMKSSNPHGGFHAEEVSKTLQAGGVDPTCNQGGNVVVQRVVAFTQNQRDEVRELGKISGSLAANAGVHQQNYICAAIMGGQGERADGLGCQEEMSPTLKGAPSGGNTMPACCYAIDQQGGKGNAGHAQDVMPALCSNSHGTPHAVCYCLQGNGIDRANTAGCNGKGWREDASYTLNTIDRPAVAYSQVGFAEYREAPPTLRASGGDVGNGSESVVVYDARGNGDGKTVSTMTGDHGNRVTDYTPIVTALDCRNVCGNEELNGTLQRQYNSLNQQNPIVHAAGNGQLNQLNLRETAGALDCMHDVQMIVAKSKPPRKYIVRRLTPLECSRLQGLPDCDGGWCNIPPQEDVTDEDISVWRGVWDEWCEINGSKRKTDGQIAKWLKSPVSESAQYQMYGNGIALPQWVYVLGRISEMYKGEKPTMASLFDGTGSFPLIWESINGDGTVLWSSEVNPEAVRVSRYRLG